MTTALNTSASPKKSIGASPRKAMRVLLVEDSPLLRETIMDLLSASNCLQFAGIAPTQDEAISLINSQPFDMLIVDIELAQGNGFEVIRATQKDSYPFHQPIVVILTNHAYNNYKQLAKTLGVEYFFDKSMDFDLAIDTIEREAQKFITD